MIMLTQSHSITFQSCWTISSIEPVLNSLIEGLKAVPPVRLEPGIFQLMSNIWASTRENLSLCFCVELVKLLPVHRYSVDIFHILVLQEYWVLMESRILLKPVLGGMRIVALSISSHEQA